MSTIWSGVEWLVDSSNWWGRSGLVQRVREHVWYSVLATVVAVCIGVPIGLWIGHTGRGRFAASASAGVLRAVPTIGVVILLFRWQPRTVWPVLAALVVLAIAPVMLNTVAGIDGVDPAARDAAAGLGLTGWQQLVKVELPCALPLVLAGIRSAMNQVVATATVAGVYGLGGLGRFIFSGYGTQRLDMVAGATLAVIALVLSVEAGGAALQRRLVSPGVRTDRRRTTV
jgi:osmoprotectant transport system permease protein